MNSAKFVLFIVDEADVFGEEDTLMNILGTFKFPPQNIIFRNVIFRRAPALWNPDNRKWAGDGGGGTAVLLWE